MRFRKLVWNGVVTSALVATAIGSLADETEASAKSSTTRNAVESDSERSARVASKKSERTLGNWRGEVAEGERLLIPREYAKAELCFRQAYNEVRRTPGASTDDVVLCMQSLAKTLYLQDITVETIPLYKKSLKLLQKTYGKNSLKTTSTLVTLAGILEIEGEYKTADDLYAQAIEIVTNTTDGDKANNQLLLADFEHRLGHSLFTQGRLSECDPHYLTALTIAMQADMHPTTEFIEEATIDYTNLLIATIYNAKTMKSAFQNELLKDQVGLLKRKSGAPDSHWSTKVSIKMADNALDEAERRTVAGNNATGSTGNGGGSVSTTADSLESTIPQNFDTTRVSVDKKYSDFAALEDVNKQRIAFYERMIAADINSLGPDHPSVARDLNGLASIYLTQHNYAEAKPLLMRALVIYEKAYLADSSPAKQTRLLLQLISVEQNPATAAVDTTYIDSLPRIPAAAQKLEVALRLNDLAFMLYRQGKVPTALQVYYWALASTANSTGDSSILAAASMADMSRALRSAGRNNEAAKLEANAGAIARRDILEKRSKLLPR